MKENSIEEDIKILENLLEHLNRIYNETFINNIKERNALHNVLSDYKRILKENELKDKTIDLMAQYIKNKNWLVKLLEN